MSARDLYYVCDRCGNFTQGPKMPEDQEWECARCRAGGVTCNAVWEFTRKDAALTHSRRIQSVKGLFGVR